MIRGAMTCCAVIDSVVFCDAVTRSKVFCSAVTRSEGKCPVAATSLGFNGRSYDVMQQCSQTDHGSLFATVVYIVCQNDHPKLRHRIER